MSCIGEYLALKKEAKEVALRLAKDDLNEEERKQLNEMLWDIERDLAMTWASAKQECED